MKAEEISSGKMTVRKHPTKKLSLSVDQCNFSIIKIWEFLFLIWRILIVLLS